MYSLLIKNVNIVNEGSQFLGSIYIIDGVINKIYKSDNLPELNPDNTIDGNGKYLFPGIFYDHVHFR